MTILQSLFLGIIQGLTEFIPVSSSAHLILVPWLLGWPDPPFVFEVLVQLGTLAAVIIYFWNDLLAIARGVLLGLVRRRPLESAPARLGWLIAAATVPAVVLGLLFKDWFEAAYGDAVGTAAQLLVTAGLLVFAERVGSRSRSLEQLGWLDALIIGLGQAAAILPGVSRSGGTIAASMARGLDRPAAARFSFLMSVPAMLGAGVLAIKDLVEVPGLSDYGLPILIGFGAAAVVGYASIWWLLRLLQRRSLYGFAAYCAFVGLACLAVALVRGG
jgi:undecaprenyl-diphosphatase